MKRFTARIATFIVICLISYVFFTHRQIILQLTLLKQPSHIIITIIFALFSSVTNLFVWYVLLKMTTEQKLSFIKVSRIFIIGNVARFIPGGVWQYPSKGIMLKELGVDFGRFTQIVFLEAFLNVLAGGVLSLLIFIYIPRLNIPILPVILVLVSLSCLGLGFLKISLVRRLIKEKISQISQRFHLRTKIISLSITKSLALFLITFLTFIFPTLTLIYITSNLAKVDFWMVPFFLGLYAFSWLMGYIAVFVPSGLGITDGLLALYLSIFMNFPTALGISIIFRVALLIGEMMFSVLVMYLTHNESKLKF